MKYKHATCLILAFMFALPYANAVQAQVKKQTGPVVLQPATTAQKAPTKAGKKETPAPPGTPAQSVTPAAPSPAADNPYGSQVWSADDVKKLCARSTNGPRNYDSCLLRNDRRIGRIKQPLDNNLIE